MEGIDKWAEPVATSKPFQSPDSHIKVAKRLAGANTPHVYWEEH